MTESTEAEQRSKEYLADMLADHALEVALDHIENSDDFYSSANSLCARSVDLFVCQVMTEGHGQLVAKFRPSCVVNDADRGQDLA